MLVGAFQIQVGNSVSAAIFAVTQHKGVGRAGIEPHVQHVKHLGIGGGIDDAVQDLVFETILIPHIGPIRFKRGAHAGVHLGVAQKEVVVCGLSADLGKAGQRHAPSALARQHPVRPRLDHRVQAIAARWRRPCHKMVDGIQRPLTNCIAICTHAVIQRLVDGHKPLRGVAVDQRRFRAPRMGVGMLELALGKQSARSRQRLDIADVGRTFFAFRRKDRLAAEQGQVGAVRPVSFDVIGHGQAKLDAHLIVVVTMAGGRMHKPRARIIGHMVAGQKGNVKVPLARATFDAAVGVGEQNACHLIRRHIAQTGEAFDTCGFHHTFGQGIA